MEETPVQIRALADSRSILGWLFYCTKEVAVLEKPGSVAANEFKSAKWDELT